VKRIIGLLVLSRLALAGAALALVSGTVLAALLLAELLGSQTGPYFGLLELIALPAAFVLGLLLMPIGYFRAKRHLAGEASPRSTWPTFDLNHPQVRRNLVTFAALTFVNTLLLGLASYRGIEYMESNAFCGMACHRVMGPEFAAYATSPHARVDCVRCHVGPGAPGFVRAKFSGVRQLWALARGTYSRPIPTPVENLRPARETCEACHWPQEQHGDRLRLITHYGDDERSSETKTVLLLHVGGQNPSSGSGRGIHWHMNLANEIFYVAKDRQRTIIPWIRLREKGGRVTDFIAGDTDPVPAEVAKSQRKMDCLDCHNRPAHRFQLPEEAVDEMIEGRNLDRRLPFLKKRMVEALKVSYADRETARRGIAAALSSSYAAAGSTFPRAAVQAVVAATQAAYERNVFPKMGLGWASHPDHLGHENFPGCFRCHDGEHKSADGRVITSECDACHAVLAINEEDPAILKTLTGLP
jgi:NapC/NirT cytochrome c family protein